MSYLMSELWPYLLGLLGVVAGIFTAYTKGKFKGRDKLANDLRKQRLEALKKKEVIRNEVDAAADDAIINEFDRLYDSNRR